MIKNNIQSQNNEEPLIEDYSNYDFTQDEKEIEEFIKSFESKLNFPTFFDKFLKIKKED